MRTGFHPHVGLIRVFQCKGTVHHRMDTPCIQKRPNRFLQTIRNARLGKIRLRAQRAARQRQTAGHHLRKIDFSLRALKKSNLDQPTIIGERLDVALNIASPNHIKDKVCPALLAHDLNEILILVIQRHLGSKRATGITFCL